MKRSELKRKTPLKRTTELKAGVGFLVNGRRVSLKPGGKLVQRSVKEKGWGPWRADQRRVVMARSSGFCEAWWPIVPGGTRDYGRQICANRAVHVHHDFGRYQEPWSSWHPLCTPLCSDHHEAVTGKVGVGLDKALRMRLRVEAAKRVHRIILPPVPGQLNLWTDPDWINWLGMFLGTLKLYGQVPPEYEKFAK